MNSKKISDLKIISRALFTLFFAFNLSFSTLAQVSTLGKEFYVAFMENHVTAFLPVTASVIVTASEKSTGYLEYNNQKAFFTLEKGQQFIHDFEDARYGVIHKTSGVVEKKSIYIKSSGNVAVHAFNKRQASADGTVVLPITALGKEYYITSHYDVFEPGLDISPSNKNYESALLIVAIEDNTDVEITPTVRVDLNGSPVPAVAPIQLKLNKGETLQLKSDAGDLTGTRVRVLNAKEGDCRNIAVFGGNKMTSAGDNCATSGDHLFQQAYPITTWGKSYIHIPLADRTSGEIIKVLASQDNTEVKINGQSKGMINKGKFLTFEFTKDDIVAIETSKPSSVSMIAKSGNCNDQNDTYSRYGDPSLVTYSPVNQLMTEMVFSSVKINWIRMHLVNILVKKGTANQTYLNGQPIGNQFKPVPTHAGFEYARIVVKEGANLLQNASGFNAIAYGSGSVESYAYAVGATLEPILYQTTTTYDFDIVGEQVACLGEKGLWKVTTDNPAYLNFTWNFGDGSPSKIGKEASHTFQKPGKYPITVVASTGEKNCGSEETFRFEVEVLEVQGKVVGPVAVCPLIDEVSYSFENYAHLGSLDWEIEGGSIVSETQNKVLVRWNANSTQGKIKAKPFTSAGCPGKLVEYTVAITEQLKPAAPLGSSGICGTVVPLTYDIPYPLADRKYIWNVIGGTILTGQNSAQVEVLWDFGAASRKIFYEEESSINLSCMGVSEVVEVKTYPELSIENIVLTDPACVGESTGRILVQAKGGSGNYQYRWTHQVALSSNVAAGLAAGNYEVMVRDASSCAEKRVTVSLKDPEPIEVVGQLQVTEVSCFGGRDGQIRVALKGGSPPYSVLGFTSIWEAPYLNIQGIGAGFFPLRVSDSKGCILVLEAVMTEPEELKVTPSVLRPGCEGSLDGQLTLAISGGRAPYEVLWTNGMKGATISQLAAGTYSYEVRDANGCVTLGTATVRQATPQLRMPTGFYPKQETGFAPVSNCSLRYQLLIWDRWGNLVYKGADPWLGKVKDEPAAAGTYSYKLNYEYLLEGEVAREEISGIFVLLR